MLWMFIVLYKRGMTTQNAIPSCRDHTKAPLLSVGSPLLLSHSTNIRQLTAALVVTQMVTQMTQHGINRL